MFICLQRFARQLEDQGNGTDSSVRSSTQPSAWRTGILFYNLGAFLLELGRATMTLRQTPVGLSSLPFHTFLSIMILTVLYVLL